MYGRILVPTDGSDGSVAAIDHAIELATAHDATLRGLYVVNESTLASTSVEVAWEGLHRHLYEEGERVLGDLVDRVERAGVPVETELVDGRPSEAIVAQADESGCDLIVMGTHGRVGLNRLLLGSVTERVVRTARVPVLTVRPSRGQPSDAR